MSALESGGGIPRAYETPALAAGTNYRREVPGYLLWELYGFRLVLVTSAAAGTRTLALTLAPGDAGLFVVIAPVGHAPSTSQAYNFGRDLGDAYLSSAQVMIPLPTFYLLPGWVIATSISGLAAGDQITSTILFVRESRYSGEQETRELLVADPRVAEAALAG